MLHYNGVNKWKSQPQNHHRKEHPKEALPKPPFHQQVNSSLDHNKLFGNCDEVKKPKTQTQNHTKKKSKLKEAPNKYTRPSPLDGKLTFDYTKSNSTVYQWNAQARIRIPENSSPHTITTNRLQLNTDTTYHDS